MNPLFFPSEVTDLYEDCVLFSFSEAYMIAHTSSVSSTNFFSTFPTFYCGYSLFLASENMFNIQLQSISLTNSSFFYSEVHPDQGTGSVEIEVSKR